MVCTVPNVNTCVGDPASFVPSVIVDGGRFPPLLFEELVVDGSGVDEGSTLLIIVEVTFLPTSTIIVFVATVMVVTFVAGFHM